jgi:hypothetical protein
MDNENLNHRKIIISNYESFLGINNHIKSFEQLKTNKMELNCLNLNSNIVPIQVEQDSNGYFINDVFENSKFIFGNNVSALNCHFKSTIAEVGKNTILNDLFLVL